MTKVAMETRLDALVDVFFKDLPLADRIRRIADCGYRQVETWGGGDSRQLQELAAVSRDCGVELVSIVMNFATEEEVAPVKRENLPGFIERIDRYSDHALAAGCWQGIVTAGQSVAGCGYQEQRAALVEALAVAGELVAEKGFKLNLEPLNTEVDHPGYFLACPQEAVAMIKEISLPNLKILYDIYHMEIMRGNQVDFLVRNVSFIGHIHAAGVPGRHEIFNGETNYPFVLDALFAAGYDGYVGLEYIPRLESRESLVQTQAYLKMS